MTVLPATYTGSPRHMHGYAQDAMTYVRYHHRPDLFITFTCNPQWSEIKEHLLLGQSASDRCSTSIQIESQSTHGFYLQRKSIWRGAVLNVLYRMAKKRATTRPHFGVVC